MISNYCQKRPQTEKIALFTDTKLSKELTTFNFLQTQMMGVSGSHWTLQLAIYPPPPPSPVSSRSGCLVHSACCCCSGWGPPSLGSPSRPLQTRDFPYSFSSLHVLLSPQCNVLLNVCRLSPAKLLESRIGFVLTLAWWGPTIVLCP